MDSKNQWQQEFQNFKASFEDFHKWIHKPNLSVDEEKELVESLNETVEKGWYSFQKYLESEEPTQAGADFHNISKSGFSSSFEALKKSFENKEPIKLMHDHAYFKENEWEVREVIYPAFKDLYIFLQTQAQKQKTQ